METKMNNANHFHGSDLETIERQYGIPKEKIVSFSANVNPLGLSAWLKEELAKRLDVIAAYPDRDYTRLREAVGAYCHTPASHIVPGNGTTELISLTIRPRRPVHAVIQGPAYSEYEREVTACGGSCSYYRLEADEDFIPHTHKLLACLTDDTDMLILCNPNNPTASLIRAEQMRHILEACRNRNILVMVDETYMEFAPDCPTATAVPLTGHFDNLVILRGVSKFFAAPGLRLGYAVTGNAALAKSMVQSQNPWTVSSLADTAGQLLFADHAQIQKTRSLMETERERIGQILSAMPGLRAYPSYANFILVHLLQDGRTANDLFEMAIRRGMMIRNCASFPFLDNTWLRFCFMSPADNDRLLDCIREFLAGNN